jgi:hypothetical protein
MKVAEIISEGIGSFLGNYARGMIPKALQPALDRPGSITAQQSADDTASQLFAPGGEDDWRGSKQPKASQTPTSVSQPSVVSSLHPDVTVTSSYPLRLRYKNGDFVLDPNSNQWMTVTGKKVASTMSSFLQSQADKL